jgi:tRNA pseudouridine55 synthase
MKHTLDSIDFIEGAMLLIDKPKHWTSFDVVNKLRYSLKRKLGVRKIKVGHAGTLDPLATGLLIVCTGKWTKRIFEFQDMDKEYTGTMMLGGVTASYDAETDVVERFPIEHINTELIERAKQEFLGEIMQRPPVFSAIKVDGKPLYHYARSGKEITPELRPVRIDSFGITRFALPEIDFRVTCSKGTYMRSLVHDFGKALGSGAYLTALCRTRTGPYRLGDAWDLKALIETIDPAVHSS